MNTVSQWHSQNRVVAWAQVGQHIQTVLHNVRKVSMRKHALRGLGACPTRKIWNLGPPRSHLLGFQAK